MLKFFSVGLLKQTKNESGLVHSGSQTFLYQIHRTKLTHQIITDNRSWVNLFFQQHLLYAFHRHNCLS